MEHVSSCHVNQFSRPFKPCPHSMWLPGSPQKAASFGGHCSAQRTTLHGDKLVVWCSEHLSEIAPLLTIKMQATQLKSIISALWQFFRKPHKGTTEPWHDSGMCSVLLGAVACFLQLSDTVAKSQQQHERNKTAGPKHFQIPVKSSIQSMFYLKFPKNIYSQNVVSI